MPHRRFEVSALNQAIYDRLVELGHIDADGLNATDAARAIGGGVSRQVVDGWVRSGRNPKMTADMQQTLVRFLGVSPLEVLRLAGFRVGDDTGTGGMTGSDSSWVLTGAADTIGA